ncbi:MAG: hypothetical protein RL130_1451 [Actinomycetota bacterium]|jgi:Flp pilus assembly protein TadG
MKVNLWKDQRGSASIEFVLLAIPLFIPLFIYMNAFSAASDDQERLRTLARESVRAFVTSANDETAFEVARSVVVEAGILLGFEDPENEIVSHISCSTRPCISPDSKIVLTLSIPQRQVRVSAIEYVTPWA